jgi:iron complex outermembrane recepter protein
MIDRPGRGLAWAALAFGLLGASPSPAAAQPAITPPIVIEAPSAVYPAGAIAARREGTVITSLTIDEHGAVIDAAVVESAGEDLDRAALDAVKTWKFRPALRDGATPIKSKIRIPFRFALPEAAPGARTTTTASIARPSPLDLSVHARTTTTAPEPQLQGASVEKGVIDVTVRGRARARQHGLSDFEIPVASFAEVPRGNNATKLLELAPGLLLTNEGGEGHPERIYLRGFDAREGQDIELSVDGVPVNESGNLHGNGFANLHFIIPELVRNLRVLEGPFDPRQGNYAVAGSAEYELGLADRGLIAKGTIGSFGTDRLLLMWGPPGESEHTFAAASIEKTDGYGQNRAAKNAALMAQYQGDFAKGSYRFAAAAFADRYHTAGVIREDDYEAGRIPFYGSYDSRQGGDTLRFHLSGDVELHEASFVHRHQAFLIANESRLLENFTGFLEDTQTLFQNPHPQRGDLIDRQSSALTFGLRGFARTSTHAFGREQEIELGYFGRLDRTSGVQYRVQYDPTAIVPYLKDLDIDSNIADLGLYLDGSVRPLPYVTLRGGVRTDLFVYDLVNNCAVKDVHRPLATNPPGDSSCFNQQDFGRYRESVQRAATDAIQFMPRGTLILGPLAGFSASASYGGGVRSIDPQYVTQDVGTPFASIKAYEAGASYVGNLGYVDAALRSVLFVTKVDRDLVFSESEGRNTLGGSSTRKGGLFSGRIAGPFFDELVSVTVVESKFDDTNLLIPYVPDLVVRSDTSFSHDLFELDGDIIFGRAGLGITYVGRRALPQGQRSDAIGLVDASVTAGSRSIELGVSATNLLDRQYRLGEFNYTSDFHSQPFPTLVPARHFSAGAPRIVLLSLTLRFGGST